MSLRDNGTWVIIEYNVTGCDENDDKVGIILGEREIVIKWN